MQTLLWMAQCCLEFECKLRNLAQVDTQALQASWICSSRLGEPQHGQHTLAYAGFPADDDRLGTRYGIGPFANLGVPVQTHGTTAIVSRDLTAHRVTGPLIDAAKNLPTRLMPSHHRITHNQGVSSYGYSIPAFYFHKTKDARSGNVFFEPGSIAECL